MSDFYCDESVLDAKQLVRAFIGCDSASSNSVATPVSNEKVIAPPPEGNQDDAEREKEIVSERLNNLNSAIGQPRQVLSMQSIRIATPTHLAYGVHLQIGSALQRV
jgi:hypothetical protein